MKATAIAIVAAALAVSGALVYAAARSSSPVEQAASVSNVSVVGGRQVIDLTAKGGYSPLRTVAQAGIPTVLRVSTRGTFDCSSALRIPSMGISKNLPPTGATEIDLGSPQAGTLQGTCGMGMYPFSVEFRG